MRATIVEGKELLQTVVWALGTGVGVTLAFSIAIYGVTRFADFNRDEKPLAAVAAATIGVVAFLACLGGIMVGIVVFATTCIILINLLVDLLYAVIDPRIRLA